MLELQVQRNVHRAHRKARQREAEVVERDGLAHGLAGVRAELGAEAQIRVDVGSRAYPVGPHADLEGRLQHVPLHLTREGDGTACEGNVVEADRLTERVPLRILALVAVDLVEPCRLHRPVHVIGGRRAEAAAGVDLRDRLKVSPAYPHVPGGAEPSRADDVGAVEDGIYDLHVMQRRGQLPERVLPGGQIDPLIRADAVEERVDLGVVEVTCQLDDVFRTRVVRGLCFQGVQISGGICFEARFEGKQRCIPPGLQPHAGLHHRFLVCVHHQR